MRSQPTYKKKFRTAGFLSLISLLFIALTGSFLLPGTHKNSISDGYKPSENNLFEPLSVTTHVNIDSLIQYLISSGQTTYMWEIEEDSAWSDLHVLLPLAKFEGIQIYVSLLPPSLSPPICQSCNYSEPYELDYITWAREIAALSLSYSNFKGYTIKNLQENLDLGYLTPSYINSMIDAGLLINENLQFVFGIEAPTGVTASLRNKNINPNLPYNSPFNGVQEYWGAYWYNTISTSWEIHSLELGCRSLKILIMMH